MTTSNGAVKGQVKGLLKGLRYISQIFDEEDDKEIQIGFPTDVKHLAHIGAENAKASQPSWLTEFQGESASSEASSGTVVNPAKPSSEDNSDANSSKGDGKRTRKSRPRSTESQSPSRESSGDGSKPSRRHSSESSRRMQRHSSEQEEKPPAPSSSSKHGHRRKSKTSSEEKEKEKEEKEGSSRRASRSRRPSKGESLTDFSFTESGGPGPN